MYREHPKDFTLLFALRAYRHEREEEELKKAKDQKPDGSS